MSMKKNKADNFLISNISVKGNLMSWENQTVRISEISRVWSGRVGTEPFPSKTFFILLFLALSSHYMAMMIAMSVLLALGCAIWLFCNRQGKTGKQIYMKLHNGDLISFTAINDNEESLKQFYNAIKKAVENVSSADFQFDANGNITDAVVEKQNEKTISVMAYEEINPVNKQVAGQLEKLYQGYEKKAETNSEILNLIKEARRLIEKGNREELNAVYKKFVTFGLINECNELGLDSLIQEIKSNIY